MAKINYSKLLRLINTDPQSEFSFIFKCIMPEWIGLLTGAHKDGTVLFVDMTGSVWNKLYDMAPVWQANVRVLHNRVKKIIKICHGRVSKTIGDCVMAYFIGQDHREHAYLCAISLLETFFLIRRNYEPDGDSTLFKFPVTIGMASGELIFLKSRDPYGLAVDLAARLQGKAASGEIVMFRDEYSIKDKDIQHLTQAYERIAESLEVKSFGEVPVFRIPTPNPELRSPVLDKRTEPPAASDGGKPHA